MVVGLHPNSDMFTPRRPSNTCSAECFLPWTDRTPSPAHTLPLVYLADDDADADGLGDVSTSQLVPSGMPLGGDTSEDGKQLVDCPAVFSKYQNP